MIQIEPWVVHALRGALDGTIDEARSRTRTISAVTADAVAELLPTALSADELARVRARLRERDLFDGLSDIFASALGNDDYTSDDDTPAAIDDDELAAMVLDSLELSVRKIPRLDLPEALAALVERALEDTTVGSLDADALTRTIGAFASPVLARDVAARLREPAIGRGLLWYRDRLPRARVASIDLDWLVTLLGAVLVEPTRGISWKAVGTRATASYAMSGHYRRGDVLAHPKLGTGIVVHELGTSVAVDFRDGRRKLRHRA